MTTYITQDHEYTACLEERIDTLTDIVDVIREAPVTPPAPVYLDVKVYASDAVTLAKLLFEPGALEKVAPNLPVRVLRSSIMREHKRLWCHLTFTREWVAE